MLGLFPGSRRPVCAAALHFWPDVQNHSQPQDPQIYLHLYVGLSQIKACTLVGVVIPSLSSSLDQDGKREVKKEIAKLVMDSGPSLCIF